MAMHNGVTNYHLAPRSYGEAARWTAVMSVVCYVISGTVKISVALVIYRLLDYRPVLKAMIVADISLCFMWTLVSTLILSLGCSGTYISPYVFSPELCHGAFYAQEASYIFFDTFHVVFPILLLWNVQIKGGQKASVIILFSVGLLYVGHPYPYCVFFSNLPRLTMSAANSSTIFAILKLSVIVEVFRVPVTSPYQSLWQRAVTWSVSEHGLGLFAATILALRPVCSPITKGWSSLSGTVSQLYGSSRRDSWASRPTSIGGTTIIAGRKQSWTPSWTNVTASRAVSGPSWPSMISRQSNYTKRPSTGPADGGYVTPRLYLARVSETKHQLMPYRSSDPKGGAGNKWNWTNQWPAEYQAAPSHSGATTPVTGAAPAPAPIVILPKAPGADLCAPSPLSRSVSYEWPPSPGSDDLVSSASSRAPGCSAAGATTAPGSGTLLYGINGNSIGGSGSPRATQRNTPDYFTCVVEANERNMTVQEYLRTLGVASRLTDRESPESIDTITGRNSQSGAGARNWFEGRRLSHMLL